MKEYLISFSGTAEQTAQIIAALKLIGTNVTVVPGSGVTFLRFSSDKIGILEMELTPEQFEELKKSFGI